MTHDHLTLVINGEIYNYKDLKARLEVWRYPWKSGNDSETALHYMHRFGIESFLKDAVGMFAFAVYDSADGFLYLAVDHFGQKPLYYFEDGDKFAFASWPSALQKLKRFDKLDRDALQTYWAIGGVMGEDFLLSGMKRVNGSYCLQYDVNRKQVRKIWRYWEPKFNDRAEQELDYYLDQAIESVKVSDVPVYLFLSGGVDSTFCATHMRGYRAVHLNGPEVAWAKLAAETCGLSLEVVDPQEEDALECLTDAVTTTGIPGMATLIPYITAKHVAKLGAKVAVIANGADELFCGYDRIKWSEVDQIGHMARADYYGGPYAFPAWAVERWRELFHFVQYDLNQTLDAASMCHSLEVRSPFLDHRLVECALSLPVQWHTREGNKTHLKQRLQAFGFSKQFTDRQKLGFSLFREPKGWKELQEKAYKWAINEGFLKEKPVNARDLRYLQASAASFMIWAKANL
jgi:asparagine synthetase B (glutamine-hydrolysing)